MPNHFATIRWQRNQAEFIDHRYSRDHHWQFDGGIEVAASASPHVVRVPYANPAYVDPEEAFVAALSSCHMLWFLDIAAKQTFVVESYTDSAVGIMAHNQNGKLAMTKVMLRPQILFTVDHLPTDAQVQAMHEEAHHCCYLANSVKTEVIVEAIGTDAYAAGTATGAASLHTNQETSHERNDDRDFRRKIAASHAPQ